MNVRPPRLLRILGLASVAAALLAAPGVAQTPRPPRLIMGDTPLLQVVDSKKEELVRSVRAAKSGVQTLSPAQPQLCTNGSSDVTSVTCNTSASGQLQNTDCQFTDLSYWDAFAFSGTSGQQVTITMTSTAVDAYLILIRPDAMTDVAQDDDSGGGTDARITFTLNETGTWYIIANSFNGNELGSYTLTLQCTGGGGGACTANSTTHCLLGGRYRVTAVFTPPMGAGGDAQALQPAVTSDTGLFWFFSANNIEIIIKVVSGCGFNSRVWVFSGGLTNVAYTITVTDTVTGLSKTYSNPQGTPSQPIQDTNAFVCS